MTTTSPFATAPPAFADPPHRPKNWVVNGRYYLPDPDTGAKRYWTRVTNMDVLSDKYGLNEWDKRMVAKGMSMDASMVAQASILDVTRDRDALNGLARRAKDLAGGSTGANLGTALHTLTERVDRGDPGVDAGAFRRELDAYRATLAAEGLTMDPQFLERIIIVPELECVGRLDKLMRISTSSSATHRVGDLKSQKSMDFGGLGIAIQLAIYSRAYAVWNEETETWEDPPAIDQDQAAVLWLPVGKGECHLYDVDLVQGWDFAKVAYDVRSRVRRAKVVTKREPTITATFAGSLPTPPPAVVEDLAGMPGLAEAQEKAMADTLMAQAAAFGPTFARDIQSPGLATWEARFRAATTVEELLSTAELAGAEYAGQLPTALKELGRDLRAKLLAATP